MNEKINDVHYLKTLEKITPQMEHNIDNSLS